MRILKLPPYYEPEQISSTHLTHDLESAYVEASFEIIIYTPMPTRGVTVQVRNEYKNKSYEEKADGSIRIHRFPMFREGKTPILRALRYVLCNIVQYWKGIHAENIDVIMGASTPPTQGVLCGMVKKRLSKKYKRSVPFVYSLQDVFPDSLVTTGLAKRDSFLYKIGQKIENYTYKNADVIIVISESIKKNIMEKGVPEEKIRLIYNWIDTKQVKPVKEEDNSLFETFQISKDMFRVVYAGNLGFAQGIETILEAAKLLADQKDIEFLIFGAGAAEEQLKKTAEGIGNVRFFPLLPPERVSEVYSLGNAGLVCCKKGIGGTGVPSKTWGVMACERPVLISFDMDSELSQIISSAKAGLCSEAGDAVALAENIEKLFNNTEDCNQIGQNARIYAENFADKKVAVEKYIETVMMA